MSGENKTKPVPKGAARPPGRPKPRAKKPAAIPREIDDTMFAKGNKAWEARSSHGRDPIYKTPEQMFSAASEYFQWVEDNPIIEYKATHHQGETLMLETPRIRAMTIQSCCRYIGLSSTAFYVYEEKTEFRAIIEEIKSIIFAQKFEGAAAEQLNANIIARELGLKDKSDSTGVMTVVISKDDEKL